MGRSVDKHPRTHDMLTLVLCLWFGVLEGCVGVVVEGHRLIHEQRVVFAADGETPAGFGTGDS